MSVLLQSKESLPYYSLDKTYSFCGKWKDCHLCASSIQRIPAILLLLTLTHSVVNGKTALSLSLQSKESLPYSCRINLLILR
jgi:hypothetical protein